MLADYFKIALTSLRRKRLIQHRRKRFNEFNARYIRQTDYEVFPPNIPDRLNSSFDYFIAGSDQIWNHNYRHGSSFDFLTFADKHKRIAYAASFGIEELGAEFESSYAKWLSEMAHISVREGAGAKLVYQLTGRVAPVLIDPTMLLSVTDWKELVSKSDYYEPYILTYFLGNVPSKIKKRINQIAKFQKCSLVALNDMKNDKLYSVDPGEFLTYISNAKIIFTDSFHGIVFSILFQKPFIVVDGIQRGSTITSRIDTLLSVFGMEGRKFSLIQDHHDMFDIQYAPVFEVLLNEQNKAINYLKRTLGLMK